MLYLIGTDHFDLKGYERLTAWLNYLKPAVLVIEETEQEYKESCKVLSKLSEKEAFEAALVNAKKIVPSANQETLEMFFRKFNYETSAVRDYCSRKNVPIVFGENPDFVSKMNFEEEAANPKSAINKATYRFLKMSPDEALKEIEDMYSELSYPVADLEPLMLEYQEREKFTAQVLRSQKLSDRVVYYCGLDHLFGDHVPNLYDLLSDLKPLRLKLNDLIP
jgi:hypothetical protein